MGPNLNANSAKMAAELFVGEDVNRRRYVLSKYYILSIESGHDHGRWNLNVNYINYGYSPGPTASALFLHSALIFKKTQDSLCTTIYHND